jgi:hypothetical protein
MAFTVLCQRHREGITSGLITPMVGRTQKYEAKKSSRPVRPGAYMYEDL